MRRSAAVVAALLVAAACSGSDAGDQVVAAPPGDATPATTPPSMVLPVLPEHGMAVQRGDDHVVLTDVAGTVVHELPQHYVDDRSTPGSIYLWRTGEVSGGRALRLDPAAHALDPIVIREPQVVAVRPPVAGEGDWRWVAPAPGGSGVELGQWDGGGGPGAWFLEGGAARPVVPDVPSTALGWLPDGRAAVALPNGVHAVAVDGAATFLTEGDGGMTWGS